MKLSFLISSIVFWSSIISQPVQHVITYSTSGLSTSENCNSFNNLSSPAVINSYSHIPVCGGVTFDGTNLNLKTSFSTSTSTNYGTAYAIAFPFKNGYTYSFKVDAKGTDGSGGNTNFPYIQMSLFNSLPNPNQTNPTACGAVDENSWSVLTNGLLGGFFTSQNSATYNVPGFNSTTNASKYIIILAKGGSSSQNSALISKVTIVETPPPTFTITPNPISVVCGKSDPIVLTINNINSTSGVTGYTWNLGTGNTWINNGSAAQSTINTSTNQLTLSPTCGITPTSISATVFIGSDSYQTNTATISSTNPSLSINGSNNFCSSAAYSINNLPCNATVNWSASPSGIVSFSCTSCTNPTLTKIADGIVTLTATVSNANACNSSTTSYNTTITVGTPTILYANSGIPAFNLSGQNFNYAANGPGNSFSVCPNENLVFTPYLPSSYSPTSAWGHAWTITGSYNAVGDLNDNSLSVTASSNPYNNFSFTYRYQNACGWSALYYGSASTINCAGGEEPFRVKTENGIALEESILKSNIVVYPNPVSDVINIKMNEQLTGTKLIRLIGPSGNELRKLTTQSLTVELDVAGLPKGIYYLQVIHGNKKWVQKIVK